MATNLVMGTASPGMEKGDLVRWRKKEGESFVSGEVLAEIETDKAIVEIPAPTPGKLLRILVPDGTLDVKADTVIAVLGAENDEIPAAPTEMPGPPDIVSQVSPPMGTRIRASPLARRLAKEAAASLTAIKGTGPHGRIVKRDVIGHATSKRDNIPGIEPDSYYALPHDAMRRTLASRLTEAVRTIPQFALTMDCRIDELMKAREKTSLTVYLLKAYAWALARVPEANVVWTESALLRMRQIDIGIAVAIPSGGILTPVVRRVDAKTVNELAAETTHLIGQARQRSLEPKESQGAAVAISNLGMFGIRQFNAIVTSPFSSMLAVGAARRSPHEGPSGVTSYGWTMTATLSCDHRAIDGALGARLLDAFRRAVEKPGVWL